jgi:hypothetical protein
MIMESNASRELAGVLSDKIRVFVPKGFKCSMNLRKLITLGYECLNQ